MKSFRTFREMSKDDLNSKFQGMSTTELQKIAKDNRKYSPKERAEAEREINMRQRVREEKWYVHKKGDPKSPRKNAMGKVIYYSSKKDAEAATQWKNTLDVSQVNEAQLDEISKKLAWNYSVFSKGELKDIEHKYGDDPNKWPKDIQKKALNRAKGMTKARNRLVDESLLSNQVNEEAPANATTSVPGAGSDSSLHTKKARLFKQIYRRFGTQKKNVTKVKPTK